MEQVLFLFGLYGFGVFFGFLFRRHLSCTFIGISGFLWGALFWVVGGLLLLLLKIPYLPISMVVLFSILAGGFGIILVRQKERQVSWGELATLLLTALAFLLVLFFVNQNNFSAASPDSVMYIATGRKIAYEGLSHSVLRDLSLRGLYVSQLQSASVFLGEDYLSAAQPAFAFTFLMVFTYLSYRISCYLVPDKRFVLTLSILSSLVLFSTYFIIFQSFYIHTNLISSVYLFVAVSAFWLTSVEDKTSWLIVGILGLLGFSLARNEAPVFALIFLLLLISANQIPYRKRLITFLPYLAILIVWYLLLLNGIGDGTKILNPERTLVIIGCLIAFCLLVLISEHKWIKDFVLPHLPKVMLGGLVIVLLFMVYQRPEHMKISFGAIISNMFLSGEWGLTWLIISFLLLISVAGPRVPWEELFFFGISSFFSTLLALSYFRPPYRSIWVDSANRMLTHILPIVVLYISMKAAQGLLIGADLPDKAQNIDSL